MAVFKSFARDNVIRLCSESPRDDEKFTGFCIFDGMFYGGAQEQLAMIGCVDITEIPERLKWLKERAKEKAAR